MPNGEAPRVNNAAEDMFVFEAVDLQTAFNRLSSQAIEGCTDAPEAPCIDGRPTRPSGYVSSNLSGFEDWASYVD